MRKIQIVFFDFDGVLTTDKSGSKTTIGALSRAIQLDDNSVHAAYRPHLGDLILGRKTHQEILPVMNEMLSSSISHGDLLHAFDATPMNSAMLELAKSIAENCGVGIITDNASDRMSHLVELHDLKSIFDPIIVSADIGSSKYTSEIFTRSLGLAGASPAQAIFIDNTPKNLEAAATLGLHVIHHDDDKNDIDSLKSTLAIEYGVLVQGAT